MLQAGLAMLTDIKDSKRYILGRPKWRLAGGGCAAATARKIYWYGNEIY